LQLQFFQAWIIKTHIDLSRINAINKTTF